MADYKAGVGVVMQGGQGMAGGEQVKLPTPYHGMAVDCWRPGPNGMEKVWHDGYTHNVVVSGALVHVINKVLGNATVSSNGPYIALHSASSAPDKAWSNISASQVGGYSASNLLCSFASNGTAVSQSNSVSISFTAGTATVSGAALLWHTTNSMATNAASAGIMMQAIGQFANSRQVINGDVLSVTVTVSAQTA